MRRTLVVALAGLLLGLAPAAAGPGTTPDGRPLATAPRAAPPAPDRPATVAHVPKKTTKKAAAKKAAASAADLDPCTDAEPTVRRLTVDVNGEAATGFVATPTTPPRGLVLFSHGYGHSSFSWQHHLHAVARDLGVLAVAMDYRGLTFLDTEKAPGIPNTRGWPVSAGAADGIAAVRHFEALCPTIGTIVNFGVSMGGNTAGLIAAEGALRRDGRTPLFDWWVQVEGVSNVIETYLAARAFNSKNAVEDIEAEMGGPIESHRREYERRTIVLRGEDLRAARTKGVVLVHGLDDGLVPADQTIELAAVLAAAGIPAQTFLVATRGSGEPGTTASGHVGKPLSDGRYESPLAGHASEMSTTHLVMRTAFDRLAAIFRGETPICTRTAVIDGAAGAVPPGIDC